jgi:molecular chaperone DnaK
VELTLSIDTSRIIRAQAYVPILDEEYPAVIDLKRTGVPFEVLEAECEKEMGRIEALQNKAKAADNNTNIEELGRIQASNLVAEIRAGLDAAKGDAGAAAKCEKRLLELKVKVDDLADAVELPALVAEVREWIGYVENITEKFGTASQRQRSTKAVAEAEEAIKEQKLAKLQRKLDQLRHAYYDVAMEQPGWWVHQMQAAEKQLDQMSDRKRGERLLSQAQECLDKNNLQGLKNVVRELWNLLPDELAEAAKRGFQSGVVA